jgi:ubiquitin-like 1-activating enzyme E1 B
MLTFKFICFFFSQLFGEDDPDEDVSPDTADPEAAGV